jgi:hypothetical protein
MFSEKNLSSPNVQRSSAGNKLEWTRGKINMTVGLFWSGSVEIGSSI